MAYYSSPLARPTDRGLRRPPPSCSRPQTGCLARSTFDLFGIVKQIVDAKAQFRSLAEPWADTGTSTGRLMIAVLGGLADVERDLIRTRTAEGRSRAQKRGGLHVTATVTEIASRLKRDTKSRPYSSARAIRPKCYRRSQRQQRWQ
jgi:DNA invertase Pin-like site-specific DNA recombinase